MAGEDQSADEPRTTVRSRRRLLETGGAALLAALAGCSGDGSSGPSTTDDGGAQPPTTTPSTTAPPTTTSPTTTPAPSFPTPYEDTLTADHPLVQWIGAPSEFDEYDYITPTYGSPAKMSQHLDKFAGGVRPVYEDEFEGFDEDFNLSADQVQHRVKYPLSTEIRIYLGDFTREEVVRAHEDISSVDEGTEYGYQVFRRYSNPRQYPQLYLVDDGEMIALGGAGDYESYEGVYRLLDTVLGVREGDLDRLFETDPMARAAYAPFGNVHWTQIQSYTPAEARNLPGVGTGLRYFPKGWRFEGNRAYLKAPMVYMEDFRPEVGRLRDWLADYRRIEPYDYEVVAEGQVAYISGSAPIERWDFFTEGPAPRSTPSDDDDGEEPLPEATNPEGTQWSFSTDYSEESTRVTYESGPRIGDYHKLGVALNNGELYRTQFRTEYDRPIEAGDSITVRTPPSQAGEDVTVSWLNDPPYFVFAAHTLPQPDDG
jgi:hypothetical protein